MNVTLDKIDNVTAKVFVNVEVKDYADKVKKELRRFAETHSIPGFRKGHVPMDQLRRRFGKQVKSDVINNEVYNEVIKYIQSNKINILGEPLPEEIKEITLEDTDYNFGYEIGLAPEMDIVLDKEVKMPYYRIEVSKEMLDEQDKSLRERFGAQVPGEEVDEKAIVKGTIMELNDDGSVKESEDAIQVINGIVGPFYFKSKEESDKFIGKKINDKVIFNPYKSCDGNEAELASMLNIDKSRASVVKGDFEMSISEIIVVRPAEHDQEFFDNVFGRDKVHNEEEYVKASTEMIANSLRGNSESVFNFQAQKSLVEKYGDMELPAAFLKKWLIARNKELNDGNIDKEYEDMLPSLKWQLIKEHIAGKLGVKIEEADVLAHAKAIAYRQFAQYGITNMDDETITDTAKRILSDKSYRSRIVEQVGDVKLFDVIKNAISLDVKNVSLEEFKEIANKI